MRSWLALAVCAPLARRTAWGLAAVTVLLGLAVGTATLLQPPLAVADERFHLDLVLAVMEGGGFPDPGGRELAADTQVAGRLLRQQRTLDTALPGMTSFDPDPVACEGWPLPDCRRSPRMEELEIFDAQRPASAVNSATQHPPLYYAVTGAVTTLVTGMTLIPVPIDLLVFVVRWLSLWWILALPWLIFALARQFGPSERTAVLASALCLLPMSLTSRSAPMVNNDAMMFTVGAVILLAAAVAARQRPGSLRAIGVLGALTGVGCLVKGLLLPFPVLVGLVPLWARRRGLVDTSTMLRQWVVGSVAWLALGGWWVVRNVVLYGAIQPRVPRVPADEESTLTVVDWAGGWVGGVLRSFFGGWMPWTRGPWLWIVVAGVVVVLVIGWWRLPDRGLFLLLAVPPAASVAGVLVTSYGVFVRDGLLKGNQGRYLLVGLPLIAVALASGLRWPGRERWTQVTIAAVVVGLVGLQVHSLLGVARVWGDRSTTLAQELAVSRAWSPIGPDLYLVWMALAIAAGVAATALLVSRMLAPEAGDRSRG